MCLPLNVKSLILLMTLWLQWANILRWSLLLLLRRAFQDAQMTAWLSPADNWALQLQIKEQKPANCMYIGLILTPKLGQNRGVETWAASLLLVFLCHIALSDFKSQSWPVLMSRKCPWPVIWLMDMEEEEIRRNVFFNYCRLRERVWTPNLSRVQSDRQMNKSVLISVLHHKSRELFSPNDVFEAINQPHYTSDSFFLCSWVVLPPYNFSPMNRKL